MGDGAHFTNLKNRIHSYIKTIGGIKAHLPLSIISDTDGQTVGVTKGSLDIHVADIHEGFINRYIVETTATTDTLNGDVSSGDRQIIIDGTSFVDGDWLDLVDGNVCEPNFVRVVSGGGTNTLTLDRELDNGYGDGITVTKVNPNIALANGSVTPVSFKVAPPPDEIWHIMRFLMSQIDATNFDTNGFWGTTALTRGVHIRSVKNGDIETISFWKKNADIVEDCFDWAPIDRAPAGKFGARTRFTLERSSAFIPLDGSTGDYIEVLAQDDLTDGEDMQIKVQGHKKE